MDTRDREADNRIPAVVGYDTGEEECEDDVVAQHATNGRISCRSYFLMHPKAKGGSPYCEYCSRTFVFFEYSKLLDDKSQSRSI